jgi:hypothetical protein
MKTGVMAMHGTNMPWGRLWTSRGMGLRHIHYVIQPRLPSEFEELVCRNGGCPRTCERLRAGQPGLENCASIVGIILVQNSQKQIVYDENAMPTLFLFLDLDLYI